jgi:hypothetical protein
MTQLSMDDGTHVNFTLKQKSTNFLVNCINIETR